MQFNFIKLKNNKILLGKLLLLYQELEVLVDPMRKEVGLIRKRIDMANRELKPLGQSCQKKVHFLNS